MAEKNKRIYLHLTFDRRMTGDGRNSLDKPSTPTERKVSPSYEGGPDLALDDGPGRGSCMHALPRPGQKRKLPPPETVVQGDNHRRRRGAAKRPHAGVGSGGLPGHQRRCRSKRHHDNRTIAVQPSICPYSSVPWAALLDWKLGAR